ncbi:Zn-ribbon domain-containing OB-fold protein [Amycolatopsis sp. FDAARGOS 1241]|uniref:Zn-ribbon domain-containing OB-fold protein n=1 Tax=Amycolatopsis sp. FDAARGOS 1241 TaxID=2778070 RepID=UPI00194E5D5F|nr:Zn-ribbon domain-containing OB-fold protein [Amycolatopsis sp. FDAARGOS 1241]QRP42832.1 Zn-ribbon domain-containing OB-fold protein [Amycolatopsis sp. FDAARGOS 1241]
MSESLSPADHPLVEPFFRAAGQGRLVVQRCDSCEALRWPPLSGCPECRGRDTTWAEVSPTGTIWSFVVYHRAFSASLKDQVPYTVAMVQLDEGPYLVGRLVDGEKPPRVGDRVRAEFLEAGGVATVRWRLA